MYLSNDIDNFYFYIILLFPLGESISIIPLSFNDIIDRLDPIRDLDFLRYFIKLLSYFVCYYFNFYIDCFNMMSYYDLDLIS